MDRIEFLARQTEASRSYRVKFLKDEEDNFVRKYFGYRKQLGWASDALLLIHFVTHNFQAVPGSSLITLFWWRHRAKVADKVDLLLLQ
jgi:hypothetical protein